MYDGWTRGGYRGPFARVYARPLIYAQPVGVTRSFDEVAAEQALAAREVLALLWPYTDAIGASPIMQRADVEDAVRKRLLLIAKLSTLYFPERQQEVLDVLPLVEAHELARAYWAVSNLRLGMIS